jgi:hypothetical protein
VGVRGIWKSRVRVSSKGPEWRICHHEKDIGPPSKWVFSFTAQRVMPRYIIHVVV